MRYSVRLDELDPDAAAELIRRRGIRSLVAEVQADAGGALRAHGLRVLLVSLGGAAVAGALVSRGRLRQTGRSVVAGLAVVALLGAGTFATYREGAFLRARYTGSLRAARDLVGPLRDVGPRFAGFRGELDRLVRGTVRAYGVLDEVSPAGAVPVLHISDVHSSPLGMDFAQQLAAEFDVAAVVDTGDLVTFGSTLERDLAVERVPEFGIPYLFVRGNHDSTVVSSRIEGFELGESLDGEGFTVAGIRFFGSPHPLYTPGGPMEEHEAVADEVAEAGRDMAERIAAEPQPPDVVLVHDGRMADDIVGEVPLVLSGHFHAFDASLEEGTLRLRNGTTGGGLLDTFASNQPVPLAAQILYFAGTPARLYAVDRVSLDPDTREISVARELIELPSPPVSPPSGPPDAP
jgi:predicted phosphodiesterase